MAAGAKPAVFVGAVPYGGAGVAVFGVAPIIFGPMLDALLFEALDPKPLVPGVVVAVDPNANEGWLDGAESAEVGGGAGVVLGVDPNAKVGAECVAVRAT